MKLNDKQLFALISALQEDKQATMAKMAKELSYIVYDELTKILKGSLPSWDKVSQIMEWDKYNINYSHYCQDVMGWPDLQDGGVFEQCVEEGIVRACINYALDQGYKPMAIVNDLSWASRLMMN